MVNETRIERGGKDEQLPGKFSHLQVHPGETVTLFTAGGGGYGAPDKRDAAAVRRDVALGYLSRHNAREKLSACLFVEVVMLTVVESRRR